MVFVEEDPDSVQGGTQASAAVLVVVAGLAERHFEGFCAVSLYRKSPPPLIHNLDKLHPPPIKLLLLRLLQQRLPTP